MRVATRSLQLQFLALMAQQQERLARLQREAATGKKINSAADNPAAAVQIVALQDALEQLSGFETNAGIARGRLNLEEQALNNVVHAAQRIRDLVINVKGPGRNSAELKLIAAEVKELRNILLDTANGQDGEGRYLFAGNRVRSKPFAATASGVVYSGDQGVRSQRISASRTVQEGDSGAEVFEAIRNGNGTFSVKAAAGNTGGVFYGATSVTDTAAWDRQQYTVRFTAPDAYEVLDSGGAVVAAGAYQPGQTIGFSGIQIAFEGVPAAGDGFVIEPSRFQSLFVTVDRLIESLQSSLVGPQQRAEFQSETNSILLDLDQALEHVGELRSRVGQRLAILDEQQSANDSLAIEVQKVMSRVQDTDFAAVISDLEAQAFALEAAQRAFARVQGRSLFSLI